MGQRNSIAARPDESDIGLSERLALIAAVFAGLPLAPPLTAEQRAFTKVLPKAGIRGDIRIQGGIKYRFDTIPWNLRCAPKPLAVVHPVDPEDVSVAVKLAAKYGIPIQARSGGHSFASYSLGGKDGALIIDLNKMDTVVVDQETWKATVGGGARLRGVTKGFYDQGKRTIAHGTCPQVGIGGHATVGGQGPLSRMYGLTLDHVLEAEVVLADGTITKASAEENPDLFFVSKPLYKQAHIYLADHLPSTGNPRGRRILRDRHLLRLRNPPRPNRHNPLLVQNSFRHISRTRSRLPQVARIPRLPCRPQ